jgi:DNA-binding SARP family transcriptional activator
MIVGLTLGQCVIDIDGERLTPESEVVFGTLLYLVTHAGRTMSRRALVELFWPGTADLRARHNLRQTVYRLRRMGARIDGDGEEIRVPASLVSLDHQRIAECPAVLLEPTPPMLGAYLPSYVPTFSVPFAEWVEEQRAVVHARVCRALMAAVGELRIQGRFGDVEALARVCLDLDPLNEDATLALAESTAMSGSRVQALDILDRYVEEVGGELRLPATILRRRIAERLPTPRYGASLEPAFVGRAASLAELTALWNDARGGDARMGFVWGDSGIGKTRLAAELTTLAIVQGARVERVSSQPVDATRPLSIFVDLVPRLLAMRGAAGVSPESMTHLRRLTEVDSSPQERGEDAPDAACRYAQLRGAIFDLIGAVTAEGALLLVLEDAHWLDATSWQLLAETRRRCAAQRLLVVLTSRVGPGALATADALAAAAGCAPVHLHPLADDPARELVESTARRRAGRLTPEASALCVRRGAGNPFFLQELVVHVLSGRGTATLPLTVQTLLEERLASLRPRTAQVLQTVALLGKAASIERLEAVLEYKTHELVDALEELEAAGLVALDGRSLVCRHELLGIEAVSRLSPASRLVLHRRAARVLEREIESSRSATWLWECASHWTHAGDGGRVVRLAVTCGEQLVEMGLPGEAHTIFTKALEFCFLSEQRLQLTAHAAHCARLEGDWSAVLEWAQRRRAEFGQTYPATCYEWEDRLTRIEANWRVNGSIADTFEPAIELCLATDAPPAVRVRAGTLALMFADNLGDRATAVAMYEEITGLAPVEPSASAHLTKARLIFHSKYGDLDEAVTAAFELIADAEATLDVMSVVRAHRIAAVPFLLCGLRDQTFTSLRRAFDLAALHGFGGERWATADSAAHAALELAEIPAAKEWFEKLVQNPVNVGDDLWRASRNVVGTRIAVATSDRDLLVRIAAEFDTRPIRSEFTRAQQRTAAAQLHARLLLEAGNWADRRVSDLLELHARYKSTGSQDWPTAVLCLGLLRQGDKRLAYDIRDDYLTNCRRERFSPPLSLVELDLPSCSAATVGN